MVASTRPAPRLAVIGGGLSGVTAAYQLCRDLPAAAVTVFEASGRLGGKLHTTDFPTGPMELGAEAFIRRRAEAYDLVYELGLASELQQPSNLGSAIYSGGTIYPMPVRTLMGLPSDVTTLAGLLTPEEISRAGEEEHQPLSWTPGQDGSLGDLVASRFGPAVLSRLVDPMLGGVYAAPSRGLGLRAVVPGVAQQLDNGARSLTVAVRQLLSKSRPGPVFAAFSGGYRTFIDELARASAADFALHTTVDSVNYHTGSVTLKLRGPHGRGVHDFDGVVMALPVPNALPLLRPVSVEAADLLGTIRTASSAVVAMEVDRRCVLPAYSGILVDTEEDVPFKAITFSSNKWPHLADRPTHLLRVSFGRLTADSMLRQSDDVLASMAREAVATVSGQHPRVVHSVVQRWNDGLPEIRPGHDRLIAQARAALADRAPALELVGAVTEGVGVPACIGSARAAAHRLTRRWQD